MRASSSSWDLDIRRVLLVRLNARTAIALLRPIDDVTPTDRATAPLANPAASPRPMTNRESASRGRQPELNNVVEATNPVIKDLRFIFTDTTRVCELAEDSDLTKMQQM